MYMKYPYTIYSYTRIVRYLSYQSILAYRVILVQLLPDIQSNKALFVYTFYIRRLLNYKSLLLAYIFMTFYFDSRWAMANNELIGVKTVSDDKRVYK